MKRRLKRTFFASWPAEARACMDYLHGHVVDGEFEAACCYEYARESAMLKEAAAKAGSAHLGEEEESWIYQYPWNLIWSCADFPRKPWNQISDRQRLDILRAFPTTKVQPLHMMEAVFLDAQGVFDELKAMAVEARAQLTRRAYKEKRQRRIYPVLKKGQWLHVLFTLDMSKKKKRLVQEFEAWLDLKENRHEHRRNLTGKTGLFKDRLKDLAVSRLYERLGFDGMLDFTAANRKKSPPDKPRAFHDARKGQSKEMPAELAPLCSAESEARKAGTRVKRYLTEVIPWEFGEMRFNDKEQAERWCKGLPKISKSSF